MNSDFRDVSAEIDNINEYQEKQAKRLYQERKEERIKAYNTIGFNLNEAIRKVSKHHIR